MRDSGDEVNKEALNTAIAAANTAVKDVLVDTDSANVTKGTKWILAADKKTYEVAIAAAQKVADKAEATQTEVDDAVTVLATATTAFELAQKDGTKVAVTGIIVTGAESAITITTNKGTLQMSAAVAPEDATNKNVTWSVENVTGEATISETGLLTAAKDGTVKVKATAKDSSGISGELVITISNQVSADQADVNAALALVTNPIATVKVAGGDTAEVATKIAAVKAYIEGLVGMTDLGVTVAVEAGTESGYKVTITKGAEGTGVKDNVAVTEFAAPSSVATVTSTIGTVDNDAGTIVDIPKETTLADFKAAITPAAGATFEVYEADGTKVATDLVSTYKVIVTAEDGTTIKTYTITLAA